jgi:hypothetical protein
MTRSEKRSSETADVVRVLSQIVTALNNLREDIVTGLQDVVDTIDKDYEAPADVSEEDSDEGMEIDMDEFKGMAEEAKNY